MIDHLDRCQCTGCFSCVQKCPKHCISVIRDSEGFLVPQIDMEQCIHCQLCEQACPQLTPQPLHEPVKVYAAQIKDDTLLLKSTSGGVFALAARTVLGNGGVVFGVAMNDRGVVETISIEQEDDLHRLQGSKYVQANVGRTYVQAKQFLENGRDVLFSGTPCQIAGLYGYLGKSYENLCTIDIICHGVPSQELYGQYWEYLEHKRKQRLMQWSFRDKSSSEGWGKIDKLYFEKKAVFRRERLDSYTRAFLDGINFRESCYRCLYARGERVGDLTIGDYWGIENVHPDFFSLKGVSCVMVQTSKGRELVNQMEEHINLLPSRLEWVKRYNGNLSEPTKRSAERDAFYVNFRTMDMARFVRTYMKVPFQAGEYAKLLVPRTARRSIKQLINRFRK